MDGRGLNEWLKIHTCSINYTNCGNSIGNAIGHIGQSDIKQCDNKEERM